jgi:quercetin dioxygenase-like cupin family protein
MVQEQTAIEGVARLRIEGMCGPGEQHHRDVRFEELYEQMPRDPSVRVGVYTAEIVGGGKTAWHLHNGAGFFVVLQGSIDIEFEDEVRHYEAGDAYSEPIGKVHRAVNPDPEASFLCVGFVVTPPDRPHVVNVREPW